jgi:hypothetical protein
VAVHDRRGARGPRAGPFSAKSAPARAVSGAPALDNRTVARLLTLPDGPPRGTTVAAIMAPAGNAAVAALLGAQTRLAIQRDPGPGPSGTTVTPHTAGAAAAPSPITPRTIEAALAEVRAVKVAHEKVLSLRPWEMFAYLPWNPSGGGKKRVFAGLSRAYKAVDRAKTRVAARQATLAKLPKTAKPALVARRRNALEKATKQLTAAEAAVPAAVAAAKGYIKAHLNSRRNPDLADVWTRLTAARRNLVLAERRAAPPRRRRRGRRPRGAPSTEATPATNAAAAAEAARAAVTQLKAELTARLAAEVTVIDAADYTPTPVERAITTWAVGDARSTLYDKVEAYATVTASGLEGKARLASSGGPTVTELLAKDTTLSASTKKILGIISEFEGQFSSLNTWDIADVTWGMVQWTTGASGRGDLVEALKIVKRTEPAAFDTRLRRYGLDVDDAGLILTRPDGTVLHGLAAAKGLQASARLSAVLAAAGADPKIQVAQLKASYEIEVRRPLGRKVRVKCSDGTKLVRVSDIITSEAAVGALTNQTVHGGYPAGAIVRQFSAAAKAVNASMSDDVNAWAADAQKRVVQYLRAADPQRVATMTKRLDNSAGSFR